MPVEYICDYCGKKCRTYKYDYSAQYHFCNMGCYNKFREQRRLKGPEPNCACKNCGKPLYVSKSRLKKGTNIFCSQSCSSSYMMKNRNKKYREDLNATCSYCGKRFHKKKSHLFEGSNFCSAECRSKFHKDRRVHKKCLVCGKEFDVSPYKKDSVKFCSRDCADEYQRRFREKHKCAYCGKDVSVTRVTIKRSKTGLYFCSNKCVGKYFSGEKSPMYTGTSDLVKVLRTYYGLHQRPKVFERDNKVCQICGKRATNVHHKYPLYKMLQDFQKEHPEIDIQQNIYLTAQKFISECSIFNDMNNLISVCEDCHKELHRDERKRLWKDN